MVIHSFPVWEATVIASRRDESKYDAILGAAVQVMAESGYHRARISQIARTAGVADGTVYLYFKNKEDVLISVLRHNIGEIVERAKQQIDLHDSAAEQLRALVHLYFGELGARKQLAMVTQVHLRQVDANIRRQIGAILRPLYQLLDEIVLTGVEQGLFPEGINRRIARRMVFGTMDETVTAWVLSDGKYPLAPLAEDVVYLLLHGLCGTSRA